MTFLKLSITAFFALLFVFPTALFASDHYSFEHAEKMLESGRILWRDYGPDPFTSAIIENKPLFVILTAPSWCYWCHVYTSDDYIYNERFYPYLNENFIPVYVDADKRQDLTRQLLEGGWPSTTVMAPNGERLFGYSGPRSIDQMLGNLQQAKAYVDTSGFSNTVSLDYVEREVHIPTKSELTVLIASYRTFSMARFDPVYGGFGSGQKFPQPLTLDYFLEAYEDSPDERLLSIVTTTLQNQYTHLDEIESNYNIFDPVEGGFHRYGTTRDWTPPHYEKMLYDNAKLLKTYAHLQTITDNPEAREVVEKTLQFMDDQFYDHEIGGFYGNSDADGEDEYYGKRIRPRDKPRIEKTKYTDWNTYAILAYLDIGARFNNPTYTKRATQTLDWFQAEMLTKNGALHYFKEDGEKGVSGNLLDNAHLLLAFIEGYQVTGDKAYLNTSKELADYSLEHLYDYTSGGFFERNSTDTDLYAPGELILLQKPSEENGIMALALGKLYTETNDERYVQALLKTVGYFVYEQEMLDFGYFRTQAATYILDHNLLNEYVLETDVPKDFWLTPLLGTVDEPRQPFALVVDDLDQRAGPILLLFIISFIAGILSFLSPCTLPILPAYLAGTLSTGKKNQFVMAVSFFLGLVLVFTALGMSATAIGAFLQNNTSLFSRIAGVLIILFGVLVFLGKGFKGIGSNPKRPTTIGTSFLFGALLSISWTPCVGPILVSVLLLAATSSSVLTGGALLFAYGVGLAVPLLVLSMILSKTNEKRLLWRLLRGKGFTVHIGSQLIHLHSTSIITGILFIGLGILMLSGTLFTFNQYVVSTGLQKYLFEFENWLLGLLH